MTKRKPIRGGRTIVLEPTCLTIEQWRRLQAEADDLARVHGVQPDPSRPQKVIT